MASRQGYTLLEVMLAVAIGLVIVGALYVAMDVQLRYMDTGRDAVLQGQLARGILSRMAADIRHSFATLPSRQFSSGTSANGQSSSASVSMTDPTQASADESNQFSFGLIGDEFELTLFTTSVPFYGLESIDSQTGVSDQRQITYSLVPDVGLVRSEVLSVAMDDSTAAQPVVLAPEVVDLHFRYFDAVAGEWVTEWDGTTDGPPAAVEITLAIVPETESRRSVTEPPTPVAYRMVVAVPTAAVPPEAVSQ